MQQRHMKQWMRAARRIGRILCVAALCFGLVNAEASAEASRKAIVSKLKGTVEVRVQDASWVPARIGMILREGDELRTGDTGTAETLLDDEGKTGRLEIKPNSHLRFNTLTWDESTGERTTLIDFALGTVMVYVNKLKGESRFEVNTPTATIGVRGTRFKVKVIRIKPDHKASKPGTKS